MTPIVYRWSGEAMEPIGRFRRDCDRQFVIGQTYFLAELEERSEVSHNHQFAWLKSAWESLPEGVADEFPSPDALRKHALIKSGFYDETRLDAGSNAAALRVAALMQADNPRAYVVVRGPIVVRRIAKSQSRRAMDKAEFQASKEGIMAVIGEMIGVEPAELEKAHAA